MDRNIAALMRQDCRTVNVRFDLLATEFGGLPNDGEVGRAYDKRARAAFVEGGIKSYKYVTDLTLAPGNVVVVEAAGETKLAWVVSVDDEVDIEPNSAVQIKWVKALVDLGHYEQSQAKNAEIERMVSDAYKANLRRSFANQIMSAVDEASRERITKLLGA